MKWIKEHSVFLALLLVCAVLRLLPLFSYQFTYDELSGLERTRFDSFAELMEKGVQVDAHPAFVQLLIFYLVKCFGYTTWIIKLPFLVFGFGAIVFGYALGLRFFSKQTGLVVALLLAFSLVYTFYAPIARMYISGVFFTMGLLYYFFTIVAEHTQLRRNYVLFALFLWLSALNQHINSLYAATVYLAGFAFLQKTHYKKYLLAGGLAVACYLPHLPITLYQLGVGGIGIGQGGWLDTPLPGDVFVLLKIVFGTGRTWCLFFVLVMVSAILRRNYGLSKIQLTLLLLFVLNYGIVYGYSVLRAPIYQHSVMLFAACGMLVLVASLIDFGNKSVGAGVILLLSGALIYKTYFEKDYLHQCVKTVYEYQFAQTRHHMKNLGEANVAAVFFDADENMRTIYSENAGTLFSRCVLATDSVAQSMRLFSNFVATQTSDFLALSSCYPAQLAVARRYFPYLIENTVTQGINYKLLARQLPPGYTNAEADKELLTSEPSAPACFYYPKNFAPNASLLVDAAAEYPFDAYASYHELIQHEGNVVLLQARFDCRTAGYAPEVEACINTGVPGTDLLYGYSARSASEFVMDSDSSVTLYADYFAGTNHRRTRPDTKTGCYIWNKAHQKTTLKQFKISVIDFWPQKWQFWD